MLMTVLKRLKLFKSFTIKKILGVFVVKLHKKYKKLHS